MQLSIVVPVYNVEKYISRCIESIIAQTNRKFELILVDDGSTDASGNICNTYAEKYSFIKVYHISNRGPGGARNFGVKKARGDYIFFVDSDDYIEKEVVDILYKVWDKEKPDIVVLSEKRVAEDEQCNTKSLNIAETVEGIEEYTKEQSIALLGYVKKIDTAPWGKLIRKDILISQPFPENVIYEDYETMYQLFDSANKIMFVSEKLYYYVQRTGSIMHSKWNDQRNRLMSISKVFMGFVLEKYPDIYPAAVHRYFFSLNELCVLAMCEKNYTQLTREARKYARKIKSELIKDRNVKFVKKIRYLIMIYLPLVYRGLWKIGKKFKENELKKSWDNHNK